ncbi:hypothetical protein [Streptococcus orisratti]|uniref:hypothetical protein n=1 Tax=Streptococcus orisratti TaxID=114652 RepID=UPI003CFCA8D8
MDKDIVPELLDEVRKEFEQLYGSSAVVKQAFEMLKNKKATYQTVNEFAIEIGDILSKVLTGSVSSSRLPDGKMYYNIAQRVLSDTLGLNYELVSDYAKEVQGLLNNQAKIGLAVQVPEINQDRIDGLANRLSFEDSFDDVAWILGEPIVNFTQSIVDDSIRKNAEFQYEAGLSPEIVRTEGGKCCDWCREVVGRYKYPKVPKDVYRRHQRCRCIVEYDPKSGKVRDIWSKIWRKKEREKLSVQRVENAVFSEGVMNIRKDIAKLDMTRASPNDIIDLGKRINYHFKVSENLGDKEKLKEIFSNFRDIGGVVSKETWAKGTSKVVKAQLEDAFSYYPKDWADIPKRLGKQLKAKKTKRGYFSGHHADPELVIATNGVRKSTPFHEIGHMVEMSNPDLVRLEKAWVDQRTAGEQETKLKDIFPMSGYGLREVTKRDNFIDPYIGKYYNNAAEVFTMGLQGIFTPEELFTKSFDRNTWKYEKKTINDDPEFLNFIIGLYVKV